MGQKHRDKKCSDTNKAKHSNSKIQYKGQQPPFTCKHSHFFDASYRYPASDIHKNHSSNKMCKGKHVTSGCQCSRFFDNSLPYNDVPPPAPPDGRTDLWDLQFCRWWGWNWVRKQDAAVTGKTDERRNCYVSNDRNNIDDQPPTNLVLNRTKKAYFSPDEPEIKMCRPAMTTKQQFKAMCKCLLGKKKTPHKISKLYNTPSASVIGSRRHERTRDVGSNKATEHQCHGEKCVKKSKRDKSKDWRCKVKSKSRPKDLECPLSERSVTENTPTESLYTQRHCSSTEESIEYLTVRLQHFRNDNMCPCANNQPDLPPKQQEEQTEQITVVSQKTEAWTLTETKDNKETQTIQIQEENKNVGPSINDEYCAEKLVKLKGKKQKTICLMVCCCGHQQGKSPVECTCEKYANFATKNDKEEPVKPQKLDQMQKLLGGCSANNCKTGDELHLLPLAVTTSLSTKKLSKFGTPSKNYPWLQNTESAGTTTSLNNIETRMHALNDIYKWLDPDLDINGLAQRKFPDLLGITDDLSYFKKIDASSKESRILLDAVCDAVLQEHEDKTISQALDDDQFKTKKDITHTYRDLGVLCNLRSVDETKTDVYTGLSKAFINSEDIGVQLPNISDLSTILERADINRLDDVMNNIFSESNDNIENTNSNESKQYKPENPVDLTQGATRFTRTGLLPQQTCNTFKKTGKRGASALEDHERTKKLKQEEEISWRSVVADGQASNRIGHIFSKIEDIVHKSKVKSAEIQKVLSIVPNKRERDTERVENILFRSSSQSGSETVNFNIPKTALKRNYRMSSDNFKGSICDTLKNNFKNYNDNGEEEKYGQNLDYYRLDGTNRSSVTENDCQNRIIDSKMSKLSIHSFLVFDEKPAAEPKSPVASISGVKLGQTLIKCNNSKGSLIPIRKRNTTN